MRLPMQPELPEHQMPFTWLRGDARSQVSTQTSGSWPPLARQKRRHLYAYHPLRWLQRCPKMAKNGGKCRRSLPFRPFSDVSPKRNRRPRRRSRRSKARNTSLEAWGQDLDFTSKQASRRMRLQLGGFTWPSSLYHSNIHLPYSKRILRVIWSRKSTRSQVSVHEHR